MNILPFIAAALFSLHGKHTVALAAFCILFTGLVTSARAQSLKVSNAGTTVELTADQIAAMPHQSVDAYDAHEKQTHHYTGVLARDILAKAGVVFGEKLRGKLLGTVVMAHAKDGYAIAFALAEFDPAFREKPILLVDSEDGHALREGMGPYRLLCPGDARPARWVRMLGSLDVLPPPASAN